MRQLARVLKYQFQDTFQPIHIPREAVVLHVAEQGYGWVTVWALVPESEPSIEFDSLRIVTTGEPAQDLDWEDFQGTAVCMDGKFVAHVFRESERR